MSPIILACYGLRRSKICALTLGDIDGDMVKICKAKVLGEDEIWVTKTTRTTSSTREIIIPAEVAAKIQVDILSQEEPQGLGFTTKALVLRLSV